MTSSIAPVTESPEVQDPCAVGECESCGATVVITDRDGTDSPDRYGPRQCCECGERQFRRVSVDEALK